MTSQSWNLYDDWQSFIRGDGSVGTASISVAGAKTVIAFPMGLMLIIWLLGTGSDAMKRIAVPMA